MLTQERVKELFEYRGGKLIWRVSKGHAKGVAGNLDSSTGYWKIGIDDRNYKAHRVIWLWHFGYLPENALDHQDQNKLNNKIENLREVFRACNARNTGNFANNISGVKGVSWGKSTRKWGAYIYVNNKRIFLGWHACFLEATCHRLAAEQALDWHGCDLSSPALQYVRATI